MPKLPTENSTLFWISHTLVGDFPLSTTMNPGETLGDCPSSIGQQWEDRAKELAFQMQQDQLQQELQELNQKLENKEVKKKIEIQVFECFEFLEFWRVLEILRHLVL